MNVLVLRPIRAATHTAQALAGLGHVAIVAPVLTIEDMTTPMSDGPFAAVLATSANGLRKLQARPEIARLKALPLVAVGDRTAKAGREAGFSTVHVAEGDGRALVKLAADLFEPPARFLHAAGADRVFDLGLALSIQGYEVEVVELYRAVAAETLPEPATRALADGAVDAVLHHSGRIAETFLKLCDAAGLADKARGLPHAALSERIAGKLRDAGCARVAVAAKPDEPSLFSALFVLVRDGSQSEAERPN